MVKKVYSVIDGNRLIIELENRKLLGLSRSLALKTKEGFGHRFNNIKLVDNISKGDVSRGDVLAMGIVNEIYDIIAADGNYYLLFMEGEVRSEVTVTPGELKDLLNSFKDTRTPGASGNEDDFQGA
ncbi:MAG: hypothetical protein Q8N16_00780 [bacterium]|nr:hypothetical protein [bacterium]